eukprot:gene6700-1196_t
MGCTESCPGPAPPCSTGSKVADEEPVDPMMDTDPLKAGKVKLNDRVGNWATNVQQPEPIELGGSTASRSPIQTTGLPESIATQTMLDPEPEPARSRNPDCFVPLPSIAAAVNAQGPRCSALCLDGCAMVAYPSLGQLPKSSAAHRGPGVPAHPSVHSCPGQSSLEISDCAVDSVDRSTIGPRSPAPTGSTTYPNHREQ